MVGTSRIGKPEAYSDSDILACCFIFSVFITILSCSNRLVMRADKATDTSSIRAQVLIAGNLAEDFIPHLELRDLRANLFHAPGNIRAEDRLTRAKESADARIKWFADQPFAI